MDREKLIKLLGLNSGIAAADIIAFSPGLGGIVLTCGVVLYRSQWSRHVRRKHRVSLEVGSGFPQRGKLIVSINTL